MTEFERRYHRHDEVWADCNLGYVVADNPAGAASKAAVVAFFAARPEFPGFYPAGDPERLTVTDRALNEVSAADGRRALAALLVEAIHSGSHLRLPAGETNALAAAFLAGFDGPRVFLNSGSPEWGSFTPVTGHTEDRFMCAVDARRVGFVLTVNDE